MRERIGGMGIKEGSVAEKKAFNNKIVHSAVPWVLPKNGGGVVKKVLCLIMENNFNQMLYDALILV